MTDPQSPTSEPTRHDAAAPTPGYAPAATPSRSFFARTLREAFRRWSARLGLAWVLVLVVCAVFAPLIANSAPLLMTVDDRTTSPAFELLTPLDVILFAALVLAIPLLFMFRRQSFGRRLAVYFGLLVAVSAAAVLHFKPPEAVAYDAWRVMLADEETQVSRMVTAFVPFSPSDRQRDQRVEPLQAPNAEHLFGTTERGEDVFARMVWASRVALGIGFVATGIALLIGVLVGGLMGYFSGLVDIIGMRLVEMFEAIPTLFLLLTIVAFFGSNVYLLMVIIGLTSWSGYARMLRAEFLKLRAQEYVQAAQALGLPLRSVLFRHMLPNGVAPLLVQASFGVAVAILMEATLSFLGLGPVDAPSWGQMLNQAVQASSFNWWMAAFPGGAIFLTVFAYNLMGEAMRDALDPYLKKSAT